MNWETACKISKSESAKGILVLNNHKLEVFRHRGGSAKICSKTGIFIRNAFPDEVKTVSNWRPIDVDL